MSIKENNNNNNNETDPRFYDIEHCLELPTSKIYDIESGSMCISDFEGTGSSLPQKHSEHIMSKEDTKDELLIAQEAAIVTRLQKLDKVNRQRLRDEKEKSALCTATEIKRLKTEFFKHRQAIESYIQERGAIVRKKYGHNIKGKNAQSKMLVTISSAPIPIEIRIHFLRAVKTKLPEGHYVLMTSIYDSLGGRQLSWTRVVTRGENAIFPAVTHAVKHYGGCFDRYMRFESSCFALCPPMNQLRPSNVLVIELLQLAGPMCPFDQVVGWTALPICGDDMSVIQGKFKLPILRGEHSPAITRFQDIDTTLRKDLGHWLCNIYFEVRCMDLLQCSIAQNCRLHSSLSVWQPLSILIPTPLYARQSNNSKIPPREQSAYSSSIRQAQLTSNSRVNRNFVEDVQVRRTMKIKKQCKFRPQPRTFPLAFSFKVHPEESLIPKSITLNTSHDAITHPTDDIFQSLKKAPHPDSKRVTFLTTDNNIDDASEPHQAALQHERSLPSSDDEDSCYNIYHSDSSTTASRVCHENVRTTNSSSNSFQDLNLFSRKDSTSTLSDSPDGVLVTRPWDRLVNPADIALYSPALSSDPARQKSLLPDAIMTSKLRYIYAEIFLDLEFRLFGSIDYFLTLSIYLAAVWTSLYVHYLGQYLFLLATGTPVYNFELRPLYVQFKYQSTSLPTVAEVGVVEAGALSCLLVFCIFVVIVAMFFKMAVCVPGSLSKYILAFGVATIFDPMLVLLVDLSFGNYNCNNDSSTCSGSYSSSTCTCFNGDFSKLWLRMAVLEGSGLSGLLITMILYASTILFSVIVVYYYIVHIHRNGCILDLWRRVYADSESIFMPDDFEVSYAELRSVCLQAGKWRGLDGSTRELIVTENCTDDDSLENHTGVEDIADTTINNKPKISRRESIMKSARSLRKSLRWMSRKPGPTTVMKCYRIFEVNPKGDRKLHREFVALFNGTIIEVVDATKQK